MKNISQIVYIATYPPRECGIATFTRDLIESFDELFAKSEETKVIAMNIEEKKDNYPEKVIFQISQNNPEDYLLAAEKLNSSEDVSLIVIEHEFGIYGDHAGKNILLFLEKIKKPVAVTLHTILPNPSEEIRFVMDNLAPKVAQIIVMTEMSKTILKEIYNVDESKIKVIPHGIHARPYTDGIKAKEKLGLSNKKVISTFGFLSRGKGHEFGIEAMPSIIASHPEALYLIIGETHPVVRKNEGEEYRESLIQRVKKLDIENNVVFIDKYLDTKDLLEYLEATDIYLSLSQNPDQAVSGTFSYALGAGRPVISTPFMQAKDMLTPEIGVVVPFNQSESISKEVIDLLNDKNKLISMGKTAYFRTRNMIWQNVALAYMRVFTQISPETAKKEKALPPISFNHIKKLTDDFGMIQFTILDVPDNNSGYTLDDNARALIATLWYLDLYKDKDKSEDLLKLVDTYINFIDKTGNSSEKFINYFTFERKPNFERNTTENLEESSARALWALAVAATSQNIHPNSKEKAKELFNFHIDKFKDISSPRAIAFFIKALATWYEIFKEDSILNSIKKHSDRLVELFSKNAGDDWQWFEEILAYSNAILPEALLIASKITHNEIYFATGKKSLDFLLAYSFEKNICTPIGQSGWFKRGDKKHLFDQQPEEVSVLVLTLKTMFDITADTLYLEKMTEAFNWFLGNNTLGQIVYSGPTGGCYDGLGEKEINLNQGAESTISYLLARITLEKK